MPVVLVEVLEHCCFKLTKIYNGTEHWRPVAYWSRALSAAERNYSATLLECTALHDAICHWRVYLLNGREFDVITDHYALVYMFMRMSDSVQTNQRLQSLASDLQQYRFTVTHRKGTQHLSADAISRLYRTGEQPYVYPTKMLRDDHGPLSAEERAVLHSRFGTDLSQQVGDIIDTYRGIRRHAEAAVKPMPIERPEAVPPLVDDYEPGPIDALTPDEFHECEYPFAYNPASEHPQEFVGSSVDVDATNHIRTFQFPCRIKSSSQRTLDSHPGQYSSSVSTYSGI